MQICQPRDDPLPEKSGVEYAYESVCLRTRNTLMQDYAFPAIREQ